MKITKYFRVNDDTLEKVIFKSPDHDLSIVVECGLDFSSDIRSNYTENKNKCNNCCNDCGLCNVNFKPSPNSIHDIDSIKQSMANDINSIINEMKMKLPIEKDLYMEIVPLVNRITAIIDYTESLKNSEDRSYIDYRILKTIEEKLHRIHLFMYALSESYRKYRETNDVNDNSLYLIHLGLAVDDIHEAEELMRKGKVTEKYYDELITKAKERIGE